MSYYDKSDRGDPRYRPYNDGAQGIYGPEDMSSQDRALIRQGKKLKYPVWARSPSPPQKKNKPDAAPQKSQSKGLLDPPRSIVRQGKNGDQTARLKSAPSKKRGKRKDTDSSSSSSDSDSDSSDSSTSSSSSSSSSSSDSSSDSSSASSSSSDRRRSKKKSKSLKPADKSAKSAKRQNGATMTGSEPKVSVVEAKAVIATAIEDSFGLDDLANEEAEKFRRDVQGEKSRFEEDDEDDEIGPLPMVQPKEYAEDKRIKYGGALLPGEGAAIAQFVQQNMRIPRRGEIGWQGDDIERLENQGYVMSGSRHARMNAVRLRKENQVYSAEEKRALAIITFEEKQQKENKVVSDFRQMLMQRKPSGDAHVETD